MSDSVRRVLQFIDPLTGLPRAIVDEPIPDEVVEEHNIFKSASMDYAHELVVDGRKYWIDADMGDEEDAQKKK